MPPTVIIKSDIYAIQRLTSAEIERLSVISYAERRAIPQDCPCMVCGYRWQQHIGYVCPARPGYFSQLLMTVIPPTKGDTRFEADEAFYKPPNFEVV